MAVQQYQNATEYLANEITILRGVVGDINSVGVFHHPDPFYSPEVTDFTTVLLVDGNIDPLPALGVEGQVDIVSLIGEKVGAHLALTPNDYQRFVLIQTDSEDIIRKVDMVTIT